MAELLLVVRQQAVVVFAQKKGNSWQLRQIHGEKFVHLQQEQNSIESVLGVLSEQINDASQLNAVRVTFLYDEASAELLLPQLGVILSKLQCRLWQTMQWETLPTLRSAKDKTATLREAHSDEDLLWLEKDFLPAWVSYCSLGKNADYIDKDGEAEQSGRGHGERKTDSDLDALRCRCATLEKQNDELQLRLRTALPIDGERLLSFLPALYPQVFTIIGGADLALLAGRVEPFTIPSPFQEYSSEVLHQKQREFRALPRVEQAQIVRLVAPYAARLKLRREMQSYLDEWSDQ